MSRAAMRVWNAADARTRFEDIVDHVISEGPQVVRTASGCEVVIITRSDYDQSRSTAKEFLLRGGKGPDQDPLDEFMKED